MATDIDFKRGKNPWHWENYIMAIWVAFFTFGPVLIYGMTPTFPFVVAILNFLFMCWIFWTDEPNNKFRWITAIAAAILGAWMLGVGSEWKINPF